MKNSKTGNLKRFMTGFMAIVMLVSVAMTAGMNTASADAYESGTSRIVYAFANEDAGFAEGTITINTEKSGRYYLYWADDKKALDGYYEIACLDVVKTGSYTFLENVAIPVDATKVIAIKSNSEPTDKSVKNADIVYNIPEDKQLDGTSEDKTLSFEALSDTQLDLQTKVYYDYAEQHFAQALDAAAERNVDFITVSGDCINNYENGTSKEWQAFQRIIAESSYTGPIYETNGNHSMKSDKEYGIEAYMTATGLSVTNDVLGTEPYYEITAKNGDHFLFIALEHSDNVAEGDEFSDEQLDWLESRLEEYYAEGNRIFIFEHAFFHGWGPGDDKEEHYYKNGLRTTSDYPNNERFRELIDSYREVFLYTGHSHIDFMYNWNYDNENGNTANLFHIPATACTTHIINGKINYTMNKKDSQCYIVDCYEGFVISNGLNIADNLIYPAYSYLVVTEDNNHVPYGDGGESSILVDVQIENATSYLYNDGAKLYIYNNASGNHFEVDSETGICKIPENATNLMLYRCDGQWGEGSKTDDVTSYFNKYGPITRESNENIFYVESTKAYEWKEGTIKYPIEHTEHTVYIAVPEAYADKGYTYKMNLRLTDGSYPKSARSFVDTGAVYNGMKVYAYTFSAEYTELYDVLGINRIQVQCYDSDNTLVFQYALLDTTYYIRNLDDKIFVAPDEKPSGNGLTATKAAFEIFTAEEAVALEAAVIEKMAAEEMTAEENTEDVTEVTVEAVEAEKEAVSAIECVSADVMETVTITVKDATSSAYIFTSGAAVYLYDEYTSVYYEVVDGKAVVPESATNLTIYRCNKKWGSGNKSDGVTSYWNKWELPRRDYGSDVIKIKGSDSTEWLSSINRSELIEKIDKSYLTKQETVDVSTLSSLIDAVYDILVNDYRYSSYEAYADIKKLYYEYSEMKQVNITNAEKTELYDRLKEAYDEYMEMKENNNIVTVYFVNDVEWSNVKAYFYNSKTGEALTSFDDAMGITKIKKLSSGEVVYEVTINQSKWDKVVFTNGSGKKTTSLDVPTKNNVGFYFENPDKSAKKVTPDMFLYTYEKLVDIVYVNNFK